MSLLVRVAERASALRPVHFPVLIAALNANRLAMAAPVLEL